MQGIKVLSHLNSFGHELAPDLVVRKQVVDGEPADPGRKAFIEPKFVPPVHGDKIPKPLMCEF